MSAALDNGLELTALHNHFWWERPTVMFMHIGGMGDEAALATAVGKVSQTNGNKSAVEGMMPRAVDPAKTSLAPEKIEAVLGAKGELKERR